MIALFKVIICLLSLVVLYEDIRFRAVQAWLFVLLLLFGFGLGLLSLEPEIVLESVLRNILLVSFIIGVAFLYFRFIRGTAEEVTQLIGLGDIMYFACMAVLFPFQNFVYLFPCSLLFSLFVWLVLMTIPSQRESIPLAGLQAFFSMAVLLLAEAGVEVSIIHAQFIGD